ncbi:hypothetical protein COO60DRAFT_1562341 [Scenedesmus sp. NREL 46B-D3]|nr:hypothetical protein COO60DRAFT_1562341 [Scenedesmus sp. NREL 46B-D3]
MPVAPAPCCCCCCCMPPALLEPAPALPNAASVGGPAHATLLVLLLLLPNVLRASCSPEPIVAAGRLSTAIPLLMLLLVVDGSADNSTSLPALRPARCLPRPPGGVERIAGVLSRPLLGAAVSGSAPQERQRRAFCRRLCKVGLGRPLLLSWSGPACCRRCLSDMFNAPARLKD